MRIFFVAAPALLFAGIALAQGDGRPDPLDPRAKVPPLEFRSAFEGYRPFAEPELPRYSTFAAGLPQAGGSGSLRNRFVGTPLAGRVSGKTGSISRVNALSGYIELERGRFLTFSVQANHHTQSSRAILGVIDSVVVEMGRR